MLERAGLSMASFPALPPSHISGLSCPFFNGFIEKGPSIPVSVFFHFKDLGELCKYILNQL